jgi:hypothetical protein
MLVEIDGYCQVLDVSEPRSCPLLVSTYSIRLRGVDWAFTRFALTIHIEAGGIVFLKACQIALDVPRSKVLVTPNADVSAIRIPA